jgi:hypothetical protein
VLSHLGASPKKQSVNLDVKRGEITVRFHANHVSASVAGDYYQALFEGNAGSTDSNSPYLLIQRQFEMPDDNECYVETHNEKYIGHFRLRHFEFNQNDIYIAIARSRDQSIHVTFAITPAEFDEVAAVLKVISGEKEPDAE